MAGAEENTDESTFDWGEAIEVSSIITVTLLLPLYCSSVQPASFLLIPAHHSISHMPPTSGRIAYAYTPVPH